MSHKFVASLLISLVVLFTSVLAAKLLAKERVARVKDVAHVINPAEPGVEVYSSAEVDGLLSGLESRMKQEVNQHVTSLNSNFITVNKTSKDDILAAIRQLGKDSGLSADRVERLKADIIYYLKSDALEGLEESIRLKVKVELAHDKEFRASLKREIIAELRKDSR